MRVRWLLYEQNVNTHCDTVIILVPCSTSGFTKSFDIRMAKCKTDQWLNRIAFTIHIKSGL